MHLIISSKLSHKLHCKETGWTKQTSARRLLPNTIIHWANFFVSVWIKPAAAADCNITCYGETAFSCCEAAAGITKRFSHNLSKTKQTQQVVTSHTHTHTHTLWRANENYWNSHLQTPRHLAKSSSAHWHSVGLYPDWQERLICKTLCALAALATHISTLPCQLSPPHSQKNHFNFNTRTALWAHYMT